MKYWQEQFNKEFCDENRPDWITETQRSWRIKQFISDLLLLQRSELLEAVEGLKKETTHEWCDAYDNHNCLVDKAGYCRDEVDADNKKKGYNEALDKVKELLK